MSSDSGSGPGANVIVTVVLLLAMVGIVLFLRHFFAPDESSVQVVLPQSPRSADGSGQSANPPSQSGDPQAAPSPPTSPPAAHSEVLWLGCNFGDGPFECPGQITQEIYRQAVLIAGRDGLGLQTRDESLREWIKMSPHASTMRVLYHANEASLIDMAQPATPLWKQQYSRDMPDRYPRMIEEAERLSRQGFVDILRQRGWSGSANTIKDDAAPPPDAEKLLNTTEELSQFAALRETHALIHHDGESLPRLGVLVRAYANLGQLTRYHWSVEYAVYTARSLLYAQRMVQRDPNSAMTLWHRAYARALAGFQNDALKDLSAAAQAPVAPPPPGWVALIDAFSRYQTGRLAELGSVDPRTNALAHYLAYLTVENSAAQSEIASQGESALAVSPRCLRVIDSEAMHCGLTRLEALVDAGPRAFSQTLGDSLEDIPGLTQSTLAKIDDAKQAANYPQSRVAVCAALFEGGTPENDWDEPSLGALARLIQETTFEQTRRKILCDVYTGLQDPADEINRSEPMLTEHPFHFILKAYANSWRGDRDAVRQALSDHPWVSIRITPMMADLAVMTQQYQVDGSNGADENNRWIQRYSDDNSIDLEGQAIEYSFDPTNQWLSQEMDFLQGVCPQSPILLAWNIHAHWDRNQAAAWEARAGDYPTVAMALGQKYRELGQWDDAERCLKKYLAASPDSNGYQTLAGFYQQQGREDQQIATLKQWLALPTDYPFDHNIAAMQIADVYMARADFADAMPYADAAGSCSLGPELICAGAAHAGTRDWKAADDFYRQAFGLPTTDPYWEFAYCIHSGRGDRNASAAAARAYFARPAAELYPDALLERGCLQIIEKQDADARDTFDQRMKAAPGPLSDLLYAMVADRLRDTDARDGAFNQACAGAGSDEPLSKLAALMRDTARADPNSEPDSGRLDSILQSATDRDREWICALTAMLLDQHGHPDSAKDYLRRCPSGDPFSICRPLIDAALREHGIDPLSIAVAHATRASN